MTKFKSAHFRHRHDVNIFVFKQCIFFIKQTVLRTHVHVEKHLIHDNYVYRIPHPTHTAKIAPHVYKHVRRH